MSAIAHLHNTEIPQNGAVGSAQGRGTQDRLAALCSPFDTGGSNWINIPHENNACSLRLLNTSSLHN